MHSISWNRGRGPSFCTGCGRRRVGHAILGGTSPLMTFLGFYPLRQGCRASLLRVCHHVVESAECWVAVHCSSRVAPAVLPHPDGDSRYLYEQLRRGTRLVLMSVHESMTNTWSKPAKARLDTFIHAYRLSDRSWLCSSKWIGWFVSPSISHSYNFATQPCGSPKTQRATS